MNDSKTNMQEKVDWAVRSLERMRLAKTANNRVDVQDHFWSFLHAARLLWYYFGAWVKQNPTGRSAEKRMEPWEQSLSPTEQRTWSTVHKLRDDDVHVQPVDANRHRGIAVRDRGIVVSGGKVLIVERYVVNHDGREIDPFKLCEDSIPLLRRFVSDFEKL